MVRRPAGRASGFRLSADGHLGFLRQGELTIVVRVRGFIIHQGGNIHAVDVEAAVAASHTDIAETGAAFAWTVEGVEHAVVVQEVARGSAPDLDSMKAAAVDAVAFHHGVHLHDLMIVRSGRIPKTASGKVR